MSWRPKEWEARKIEVKQIFQAIEQNSLQYIAGFKLGVEAGADAMYDALRKLGNSKGGRVDDQYRKGTWVFLDDKEVKDVETR